MDYFDNCCEPNPFPAGDDLPLVSLISTIPCLWFRSEEIHADKQNALPNKASSIAQRRLRSKRRIGHIAKDGWITLISETSLGSDFQSEYELLNRTAVSL
jgi:hypothetical protein